MTVRATRTPAQQMSVRELIVELARIEDAMREADALVDRSNAATGRHPERLALASREREVVAALRQIREEVPHPARER